MGHYEETNQLGQKQPWKIISTGFSKRNCKVQNCQEWTQSNTWLINNHKNELENETEDVVKQVKQDVLGCVALLCVCVDDTYNRAAFHSLLAEVILHFISSVVFPSDLT